MKRIAILGVFLLLGAATLTQAQDRKAAREARRQQLKLGRLARSVQSLEDDQRDAGTQGQFFRY